jgi:hypothetical protein
MRRLSKVRSDAKARYKSQTATTPEFENMK